MLHLGRAARRDVLMGRHRRSPIKKKKKKKKKKKGAARVICAALEDIAGALVEGGGALPGNGLVAARSIVRP